jgi:hypothetical protein
MNFSNGATQHFPAIPDSGGWSRNHGGKVPKSAAASG